MVFLTIIDLISSSYQYSTYLLLILQGFLGAAVGAVGVAVTSSLAGSGLSAPVLPAVSVSAPKASAPSKPAASAPKSKIAFIKEPKGECERSFVVNFVESWCDASFWFVLSWS